MNKPLDKVTQAVKLKCQAEAIARKAEKLVESLSFIERQEYNERVKCDH